MACSDALTLNIIDLPPPPHPRTHAPCFPSLPGRPLIAHQFSVYRWVSELTIQPFEHGACFGMPTPATAFGISHSAGAPPRIVGSFALCVTRRVTEADIRAGPLALRRRRSGRSRLQG